MGFLNRIGFGVARLGMPAPVGTHAPQPRSVSVATPSFSPRAVRTSRSLKDFMWHLNGLGRGHLLDLGPVWQSTVSFFVERGFRVSTEDLLSGWRQFSQDDAERRKGLPADAERPAKAELANKFLESNLQFEPKSFDAVLAWDVLDYLEEDVMRRTAERLGNLVCDGGVVLSIFHSARPEQFHRYRVLDEQTVEMVPAPTVAPLARSFQNREIANLFSRFHTTKTYLGRDQMREALFVK